MPSRLHSSEYQIFRELLIKARENSGLTQVQMAELLHKPQSFISKYERGERRLDLTEFIQIADIMKVDVHVFIRSYRSRLGISKRR